jgi:hypothetical protein
MRILLIAYWNISSDGEGFHEIRLDSLFLSIL